MKIRLARFNLYLLLLVTVLTTACETTEERKRGKEISTLRVFLEAHRGGGGLNSGVTVYRQNPIHLNLEREPFLAEVDLVSAAVIEVPGGYAIRTQFDGHGALLLEGVTVSHRGRHLAIQSNFGESRWLAAPLINRRISNGELVFTPDATREEADRIVRGLTNVVLKIKKRSSIF